MIFVYPLIVLAVGLLVYAFCIEPYSIRISRIEIRIPELPESMDGFTICHVSDTHTAFMGKLENKLKSVLDGIDADLCAVTGDLARKRRVPRDVGRLYADFHPQFGIFAVSGNSEYRLKMPLSEFVNDLQKDGIHFLQNRHISLPVDGTAMHVIGVDDPFGAHDDLDKAMSGLDDGGFRLLLAHSPDILKNLGDHRIHLILAGHTHGGQFKLPGVGALWLHCRYNLGLSDGYYGPDALSSKLGRKGLRTHLYISRGLGSSNIQARFLCPPEIAVITLRR